MQRAVLTLVVLSLLTHAACAQDAPPAANPTDAADDRESIAVTVYSSADPAGFDPQQFIAQQRLGYQQNWAQQVPGFGVVKEVRTLDIPASGTLRLTDVAEFIDPTTVTFADLDAPNATSVLDQSFEFDLVSPSKLIERYIDREISYLEPRVQGESRVAIKGTVLSANQGQVVLQTEKGLRFLNAMDSGIRLPKLPDGLITKPTLVWNLASDQPGKHRVRTTYQTSGITWRSDYSLTLSADDTSADLGAWVTLLNLSGASYENARLKLIAGDVQRVTAQQPQWGTRLRGAMEKGRDSGGFDEKSFFEYHLYTLPRKTTIKANATQQIALFPNVSGFAVEKVLVYYGLPDARHWYFAEPRTDRNLGNQSNKKVDVYVKFENSKENRLGMPLPNGKVRVYKRDDGDGTLEFIGEDLIDHTPRDETVLIKLGSAFDVVGERTQTDFKINANGHMIEESIKIQLRNHKDEAAKVIVKENLYRWTNWELVEKSDEFEKVDSRTIHFTVNVPAHGEKTVTYKVRYTW